MSVAAGAGMLSPRWLHGQATAKPNVADRAAQMRAAAANTPIKTTRLYDNVYLLQGSGGNMAAQTGADGKVLIDSSFSTAAPRLRAALDELSKDPADALINTHWHIDHTDGNEGMHAAGFTIFAHTMTRARMAKATHMKILGVDLPPYPAAALPVITFEKAMHAEHNGDTLDLVHMEPAHTDSDIYIHFHKADVLHAGDVFWNGFYPFIDEETGGSIGGMIRADDQILAVAGAETKVIPGHGPLGTKAQLQEFRDMLATVRDRVDKLKRSGASEQEVVAKKPTADLDAKWAHGGSPNMFVGIAYRTV